MANHITILATTFIYNLFALNIEAQKIDRDGPPRPMRKQAWKIEAQNHHCTKTKKETASERGRHYPFNISKQIKLVSFAPNVDTSKFHDMKNLDSLPRLNDTVCYSKLAEIKLLSPLQLTKLTDIIYNYGYRGPIAYGSIPGCHNPRNAILFLDSAGKLIEYIEICFECRSDYASSEKVSLGDICDEKFELLSNFFKSAGIRYGVTQTSNNDN